MMVLITKLLAIVCLAGLFVSAEAKAIRGSHRNLFDKNSESTKAKKTSKDKHSISEDSVSGDTISEDQSTNGNDNGSDESDRSETLSPGGDDNIIDVGEDTSPVTQPTKAPAIEPTPTMAPISVPASSPTANIPTEDREGTSPPGDNAIIDIGEEDDAVDDDVALDVSTVAPFTSPTDSPSSNLTRKPTSTPTYGPTMAPTLEPTPSPSTPFPTTSFHPTYTGFSATAIRCPGFVEAETLNVWWNYAVGFRDDSVDRPAAMRILENKIAGEIEDYLLYCKVESNNDRRLDEKVTDVIGGLDYMPLDTVDSTGVCPNEDMENCVVYRGQVTLLFTEEIGDTQAIETEVRDTIRSLMENVVFIKTSDIQSMEYLGPNFGKNAVENQSGTSNNLTSAGVGVSGPTVVMVSLSVVCIIVGLTAGYRYKNRATDDNNALSTIGPGGSQLTAEDSKMSESSDSTPGFQAMMPPAYRLGESHCMDAILEGETSEPENTSDIIVSESGFSTDDSRENSEMQYSREHVLGAEALREDFVEFDDYLYEESDSEIQSPYETSNSLVEGYEGEYTSSEDGQSMEAKTPVATPTLAGQSPMSYCTDFSV